MQPRTPAVLASTPVVDAPPWGSDDALVKRDGSTLYDARNVSPQRRVATEVVGAVASQHPMRGGDGESRRVAQMLHHHGAPPGQCHAARPVCEEHLDRPNVWRPSVVNGAPNRVDAVDQNVRDGDGSGVVLRVRIKAQVG